MTFHFRIDAVDGRFTIVRNLTEAANQAWARPAPSSPLPHLPAGGPRHLFSLVGPAGRLPMDEFAEPPGFSPR